MRIKNEFRKKNHRMLLIRTVYSMHWKKIMIQVYLAALVTVENRMGPTVALKRDEKNMY